MKFIDRSRQVKEIYEEVAQRALTKMGIKAERYAKQHCRVDTGRLRNSITYATKSTNSGITYSYKSNATDKQGKKIGRTEYSYDIGDVSKNNILYIGSNVEYARDIEDKDHMLRDSIAKQGDVFEKILKMEMKRG